MNIKSIFILFIFLLAGCSSGGVEHSNTFKAGNLSMSAFADQENYFIVMPFEWMGENAVVVESVELATQDGKAIDEEQDGIRYAFHGADPKKAVGVYQRKDLGDLDEIRGFEVEGESRLVLEVSLNQVQPDPDRRIKITYTLGGKKHEQLVESTTIEELRTQE